MCVWEWGRLGARAGVRAGTVTGSAAQAGVDRYEPDWAAYSNWKLRRAHRNSASHWTSTLDEIKGKCADWLFRRECYLPQKRPCSVWPEKGEERVRLERKGVVTQKMNFRWTCCSHANPALTQTIDNVSFILANKMVLFPFLVFLHVYYLLNIFGWLLFGFFACW